MEAELRARPRGRNERDRREHDERAEHSRRVDGAEQRLAERVERAGHGHHLAPAFGHELAGPLGDERRHDEHREEPHVAGGALARGERREGDGRDHERERDRVGRTRERAVESLARDGALLRCERRGDARHERARQDERERRDREARDARREVPRCARAVPREERVPAVFAIAIEGAHRRGEAQEHARAPREQTRRERRDTQGVVDVARGGRREHDRAGRREDGGDDGCLGHDAGHGTRDGASQKP